MGSKLTTALMHLACIAAILRPFGTLGAAPLVINSNASDPAPRAAWERVVTSFKAENRDLEVRLNVFDHESYKRGIRNWLTSSPPDVVLWFAGARMRRFVDLGLFLDVSELFGSAPGTELSKPAIDLVTVNNRQYGVPYAHYHIGLFFRQDLFHLAGIAQPPADWDALLAACGKLIASGVQPIAIGTRDLWPAAAWFDYINLRSNGFRFHMALMDGKVAYTDERVRAIFARWRQLLDADCFVRHHASSGWQESQALLYQGRAAMMLIGSYIVPNFPQPLRNQMGFLPFPSIVPGVGAYEDAPVNSLHIPSAAGNPEAAKRFLRHVMRADVQEVLNHGVATLPVNRRSVIADDRFLQAGRELLSRADNLAQFFDRDTDEELATIAMKGFQEFMLKPDRLDAILANIERARERIYGKL
jgi:multiple sugar transport system substrate-binding protein